LTASNDENFFQVLYGGLSGLVFEFVEFLLPGKECTGCEGGYVKNQGYTASGNQCRECGGAGFQ